MHKYWSFKKVNECVTCIYICCLLNVKSVFTVVTDAASVAKKGNHTLDGNKLQVTVGTESDEEDSPGQHKATRGFPAAGANESSSDEEDSGGWSEGQSAPHIHTLHLVWLADTERKGKCHKKWVVTHQRGWIGKLALHFTICTEVWSVYIYQLRDRVLS